MEPSSAEITISGVSPVLLFDDWEKQRNTKKEVCAPAEWIKDALLDAAKRFQDPWEKRKKSLQGKVDEDVKVSPKKLSFNTKGVMTHRRAAQVCRTSHDIKARPMVTDWKLSFKLPPKDLKFLTVIFPICTNSRPSPSG